MNNFKKEKEKLEEERLRRNNKVSNEHTLRIQTSTIHLLLSHSHHILSMRSLTFIVTKNGQKSPKTGTLFYFGKT